MPQVPEDLQGYARRFLDDVKTTESAAADDPALDALLYRTVAALGPIGVARIAGAPVLASPRVRRLGDDVLISGRPGTGGRA